MNIRVYAVTLTLMVQVGWCSCLHANSSDQPAMAIEIDARDLPRKLLRANIEYKLPHITDVNQTISIWYPKWVPGSHGPGGPIANVAGLVITNSAGKRLSWKRAPGEVFRIDVDVPAGTSGLKFGIRYIANQPTTNSMGHDVFGSANMGVISPNCVLLYPDGTDIDQMLVTTSLLLPTEWTASAALPVDDSTTGLRFLPVSLRQLVDSPIMCGQFHRQYDLTGDNDNIPVHHLQVYGDTEAFTEIDAAVLDRFSRMVAQASYLMGSHPFDHFEILLAVSDVLPANGLEHSRSTLNVLPSKSVASLSGLKGWYRLLVPHEYMHAWCGKYRRPAPMLTSDFHSAKGTELLWVYEGLTQYLGELVEARCGLMTEAEFVHRINVEIRNAMHQQGRAWRPLIDTAAASHTLRAGGNSWGNLRRSQDYYMEGMLLWLEIDAILRKQSSNKLSIENFCHEFFQAEKGDWAPRAFDRAEVVSTLDSILDFDWDGLLRRRVETVQETYDPAVVALLGYRIDPDALTHSIPGNTFRATSGLDAADSIGAVFASDGSVKTVLLDTPADRARLAPGMKVIGVGEQSWSTTVMQEALRASSNADPVQLLVKHDMNLRQIQVQYDGGLRYIKLVRDEGSADLLHEMLQPLGKGR